jgi:hypothetical protein
MHSICITAQSYTIIELKQDRVRLLTIELDLDRRLEVMTHSMMSRKRDHIPLA